MKYPYPWAPRPVPLQLITRRNARYQSYETFAPATWRGTRPHVLTRSLSASSASFRAAKKAQREGRVRVREWLGHTAARPPFFSVFGRTSETESQLYYVTSQNKWIDVPVVRSFGFRSSWKAETARSSVTKVGAVRQQFGTGTNKRRSIKIYNEQSDPPGVHLNYGGNER